MAYAAPILFVLFVWWFSTGAVIYLNNLPPRTFPWTLGVATALLYVSIEAIYVVRDMSSEGAAYCSFACGLLAWAWTQLTFYTGAITGPRRKACAHGCGGVRHFWHAIETCLYHEIVGLVIGGLILAASFGGANQAGAWTYDILWLMHTSAKLNAVFGVRNLNEEFFPQHLKYLRSFLRQKPINPLFPLSVTFGTIATVIFFNRAAVNAPTSAVFTLNVFLGTLMALAVLEHWLLILPIPAERLWAWGVSARAEPKSMGEKTAASVRS